MRLVVALVVWLACLRGATAASANQCREQSIVSAQASGPLALAAEGETLFLTFAREDSSIGLTYPMRMTAKGRRLTATIRMPRETISMPAFGTNYGRVAFPARLSGAYRLDVRFGDKRAHYDLVVGDVITVTPRGSLAPELAFAVHEWRRVPPGFTRVRCVESSACAIEACAQLMATPPLATMPLLPNAAYLDVTSYAGTCVGSLSEAELDTLRKQGADLEGRACGSLVIDAAAQPRLD